MKNKSPVFLLSFMLLFFICIFHYFLWVQVVEPVPDVEGQYQYIHPVLNYFLVAEEIGNEFVFLRDIFFDRANMGGGALIAYLLFFSGLSSQIIAEPYLLNVICLLPFLICCCFYRGSPGKLFISGLIIYFFPVTQICLKQFSAAGLTVAYSLLGLLCFRSWLVCKKPGFLWGFALSFWFAAIMKHTGIIFLLGFLVTYLVWGIINRNLSWRILVLILFVFIAILPFCDLSGLIFYVRFTIKHNVFIATYPELGLVVFILSAIVMFLLPVLIALFMRTGRSNFKKSPRFLRNYLFIPLMAFLLIVMIWDFFSPVSIAFLGGGVFLYLLHKYSFAGVRGFVYLYIIILSISMLVLYRSGIGHMPYVLYFPMLLLLLQTLSENERVWFRIFLLLIFILISNFFPNLKWWRTFLDYKADQINIILFRGVNRNLLNWQPCLVGALKKAFSEELLRYDFKRKPLFLVENMENDLKEELTRQPRLLFDLPPLFITLPDDESGARDFLERYAKEGEELFDKFLQNGDIPLLFYVENSDTDKGVFNLLRGRGEWTEFNQKLIDYLSEKGALENDYNCYSLPEYKPLLRFCIDRKIALISNTKRESYGKREIRALAENWYQSRAE